MCIINKKEYWKKCIPLALHGDGVPVTGIGKSWSKSVDVWSWCSCLVRRTTLESNFVIICIYAMLMSNVADHMTVEEYTSTMRITTTRFNVKY